MYVVSLPIDVDDNSHKDETGKGLPQIPTEQPTVEHKQQKRLDAASSSYAFAEKEQKDRKDQPKDQDPENENRHLEKRDTESKKTDDKLPTSNQKDRKIRDTNEQPNKSGDTKHNPIKSIRNIRSTEQKDKVPDKHEQKPEA